MITLCHTGSFSYCSRIPWRYITIEMIFFTGLCPRTLDIRRRYCPISFVQELATLYFVSEMVKCKIPDNELQLKITYSSVQKYKQRNVYKRITVGNSGYFI